MSFVPIRPVLQLYVVRARLDEVEPMSYACPDRRPSRGLACLGAAAWLALAGVGPVAAQTPSSDGAPAASVSPGWQPTPWADSVMLQSQLFFSITSADGKGVSEQQWAQFVADTVLPRFPAGFTVIDASGIGRHGAGTGGALPLLMTSGTRLLMVVHPNTPDAQAKLSQIKAAYAARFGQSDAFHVDFPVRVVN